MPRFQSEKEEADWWYAQRDAIAEEFARVKPKPGPSGALQMLAKARGITVEEVRERMKAGLPGIKPERQKSLRRSA